MVCPIKGGMKFDRRYKECEKFESGFKENFVKKLKTNFDSVRGETK